MRELRVSLRRGGQQSSLLLQEACAAHLEAGQVGQGHLQLPHSRGQDGVHLGVPRAAQEVWLWLCRAPKNMQPAQGREVERSLSIPVQGGHRPVLGVSAVQWYPSFAGKQCSCGCRGLLLPGCHLPAAHALGLREGTAPLEERVPHKPPSANFGRAARRASRPPLAFFLPPAGVAMDAGEPARFCLCCGAFISCPAQPLVASRAGAQHGGYTSHLSWSALGELPGSGMSVSPPDGVCFCCSWPGEHSHA